MTAEHLGAGLARLIDMLARPLLDIDAQRREREVLEAEYLARSADEQTLIDAALALGLPAGHPLRRFAAGRRDSLALENDAFQRAQPHLPIDVGLEHLGVDEEPDQSLGFDPVAIGDRHADTDIRLTAVAIQQRLERCQQQHEGTRTLPLGKRLQPPGPLGAEFELQPRAAKALLRRTGTIERHLQHDLDRLMRSAADVTLLSSATLRKASISSKRRLIGGPTIQWQSLDAFSAPPGRFPWAFYPLDSQAKSIQP